LTMGALTVLYAMAIWFLVPEVRSSPFEIKISLF
jgi:hypothetical protein